MDEYSLRERAEEREYPDDALDDLLSLNAALEEARELIEDLLDGAELSAKMEKRAASLIQRIEEGILEE